MVIFAGIDAVVKIISDYTGYRKDKIKEDDLLVRKRLISEIEKSEEHTKNILDLLYDKNNNEGIKGIKKVKDELDVFANEADLSLVGHRYPFFTATKVRSPSESDLKKMVEYDLGMLDKMVNVTMATSRIEDLVIGGEKVDYTTEFSKMRQYVTKARNSYRDRNDFLRGWK